MRTLKNLKELKRIKAERIAVDMPTIEQLDEIREKIKRDIINQFGQIALEKLKENKDNWTFENHVFFKPKTKKITMGEIEFRSKDYIFHYEGKKGFGEEIKSDMLTDYGFKIPTFQGGFFEYHFQF